MIKITPVGTTAVLTCGLKPTHKNKDRGRLGEGAGECRFSLGQVAMEARWKDNRITAEIIFENIIYVREVMLCFHYRSSKPKSSMAVWTESFAGDFKGPQRKPSCSGSWAYWLSESSDSEGIFFRLSPGSEYPVFFKGNTFSKTITVTWQINREFSSGETVKLPDIGLKRGYLPNLAASWRREWKPTNSRELPDDRRRGWFDTGEIESPKELREILSVIRSKKIPLDWYAIGPQYASETGDWLAPKEPFRDRMGAAARSVSEHNYIPAIRFAPFLVSRKSTLARKNRDWLVKGPNGSPLTVPAYGPDGEKCHILDVTHPGVTEHIERTLLVMRDQWGIRAFFTERLEDITLPGIRTTNTIGPCGLLNTASSLIRTTLGNRVLLSGADIPLLAAPETWDARSVSSINTESMKRKNLISTTSALLHRSEWNGIAWINASGPIPVNLFKPDADEAACTARDAVVLSSGLMSLTGDPRTTDEETLEILKKSLEMFESCRKGHMVLSPAAGKGRKESLIVRNDRGWIGLFNLSGRKQGINLEKDTLKASLGVTKSISAGDGVVFNSPEIHVTLAPWGHRLFRG